jgi:hypothetical protein
MRMGLVSNKAVQRVRGSVNDTGTGPVGAVSSGHIDDTGLQKAGRGFGNAERDFGATDAGLIDAKANRKDYGYKLKGKGRPAPRWSPRWFDWQSRIRWDSGSGTPPNPDSASGGRMPGEPGDTGTSWLDRSRRGE